MGTEAIKANTLPDSINGLIGNKLREVEECIRRLLKTDNPLLTKIGSYICCSGGKRIRPILLLLSSQLSGYEGKRDVFVASIIEFIHAATLLHDDVIDQASFRRGCPSANKRWGDHLPVLVGDYLYARSFYWLVNDGDYSIMSTVSSATANVTDGEIFQLYKAGSPNLSEAEYMYIITQKTASLIAASCKIGGILGGLSNGTLEILEFFGKQIGIAYQLVDDALDFLSTDERLGKPTGNDLRGGNITYPLIYTLSLAKEEERLRLFDLMGKIPVNGSGLQWAIGLVRKYKGAEFTLQRACEHIDEAIRVMEGFPESPARKALLKVANFIIKRDF